MLKPIKSFSNFILIVFIGLLSAFIVVLADWTAPAFTPPTCPTGIAGCDIPLNTGAAAQTKTGMLNINENWNPNQQLSINSNQIWKSVTTGDPNLYLQWSTEGGTVSIGDNVGAANSLYVHGGGYFRDNVGIGITAPGAKLHVCATSICSAGNAIEVGNDVYLADMDTANTISINGVQNSAVGSIRLGRSGGTISGYNGNVGIGVSAPLSRLSVGGNGVSGAGIYGFSSSYDGIIGQGSRYGVFGNGNSGGVFGGSQFSYGVYGYSGSNIGVYGEGWINGIKGTSLSTSGIGVYGSGSGGSSIGVYGSGSGGSSIGVYAYGSGIYGLYSYIPFSNAVYDGSPSLGVGPTRFQLAFDSASGDGGDGIRFYTVYGGVTQLAVGTECGVKTSGNNGSSVIASVIHWHGASYHYHHLCVESF